MRSVLNLFSEWHANLLVISLLWEDWHTNGSIYIYKP